MKKNLTVLICVLFLTIISFSQSLTDNTKPGGVNESPSNIEEQKFVFNVYGNWSEVESKLRLLNNTDVRKHFMGYQVARRFHLFEEYFTYYSEAAPGAFSGRKVIRKPVLYQSIFRLEKHLKRQLKEGTINLEYASDEMSRFLDIAIILAHEDTVVLEDAIQGAESAEDIINVFNSIEIYSR